MRRAASTVSNPTFDLRAVFDETADGGRQTAVHTSLKSFAARSFFSPSPLSLQSIMPSDDEINRLRSEVSGDEEVEATFKRLRQDGHSRLEAVRMILDVLDVSLAEAKTLLLTNDTWEEAQTAAGGRTGAEGESREASGADAQDDSMPPAPG